MSVLATEQKDQLLTIDDAAAILAVNVRMIRQLIETRRIAFVKVGRLVRIRESEIHRAIEEWTVEPLPTRSSRWK